jgi:protein TonB
MTIAMPMDFTQRAPRVRRAGVAAGIVFSLLCHAGVGYYVWKMKFDAAYNEFSDHAVAVVLFRPPPIQTPKPLPVKSAPRAQSGSSTVQPRLAAPPPIDAPAPPSLPIAAATNPVPPTPSAVEGPPAPPAAAPAPPHPTVIANPDWLHKPSGAEVAMYYPERAMMFSAAGRAELACRVSVNGGLFDCRVTHEAPIDYGFGAAALKLSRLFQMRPLTRDGAPVGGARVTIPIEFTTAQP